MKLFASSVKKSEAIGVEFNANGIAFAHVQRDAGQLPHLKHAEFLPNEATDKVDIDRLQERLAALGLQGLPCNLALNNENYQLLLVEAPAVPEAELVDALRWRIKDLINFPVSDAIIDAFLLPEECSRGGKKMAYVAVVKREVIAERVGWAKQASLMLNAIDIAELAMRNIAQTVTDTSRGLAVVMLYQGGGSLQLVRNSDLYLARNFKLNYNAGLLDDIPIDALTLELQRSLDYFERQMKQPPPSQIFISGENLTPDKITEEFKRALPANIELLPITQGISLGESVEEHTLPLCYSALGAALREEGAE